MRLILKYAGTAAVALAAGTTLSPGAAAACCGAGSGARVERTQAHMGTALRAEVWSGTRAGALAASESAFTAVRETDALLSTWRPSELGMVNGSPVGVPVRVSARLGGVLERVVRLSRATGGAFDPAVGALIDAWDLRGTGRRPTEGELSGARAASGLDGIELDAAAGTVVRRRPGLWLDAGGFGKGAALDAAAAAVRRAGASAVLNFGGQVQAVGRRVRMPVASPADRRQPVVLLALEAAAATSSSSERTVEAGGEVVGHVLDPRTGTPVEAWGSVTVLAEDGLSADALATGLFVLGPEESLRRAAERGWAVLVVERTGSGLRVRWSPALRSALVCVAAGVRISEEVRRCDAAQIDLDQSNDEESGASRSSTGGMES